MELQTITAPGDTEQEQRQSARKAFLEYRAAVRERHNEEDAQIMRGYRALSQGKQLLHLTDTIRAGGLDKDGRPRLAIMRADQRWCYFTTTWDGWTLTNDGQAWRSKHRDRFRFSNDVLPVKREIGDAKALVPLIPPCHRPAIALSNFHILWEADWQRVPRDPALLRHLGGDLYAVVAVWDLTEVERAVLGGRF